ncbi:hypothetical protein [Fibrobacter sp.]|uniref:hypothetical protein n=1 Tax=Fibrobacter sp. TaxID=35828 RepID=UPI003890243C
MLRLFPQMVRLLGIMCLTVSLCLLVGCADPTHIYHPLEVPEKTKGEYVKYEGVKLKERNKTLAFEIRDGDTTSLFSAEKFCYDKLNDYVVFPTSRANEGYYLIVPRDSINICKKGKIRNNSEFSRNHVLHGLVVGAIVVGGAGAVGGLLISPFILVLSNGSANMGAIILTFAGAGMVLGGVTGAAFEPLIKQERYEEIQYSCSAYYDNKHLEKFLNKNSCY